jgi:hypothetical protein
MVQQLYSDLEKLKDEVRRLRGRLNAISVGGGLSPAVPGTSPVPPPLLGAMVVGNSTPAWERLPPPTPAAGEEYELTFNDGDTKPVWRLNAGGGQYRQFVYEVSGGDFTFIIDGDGNPVFALEDLE